jgi:hypothetical protein
MAQGPDQQRSRSLTTPRAAGLAGVLFAVLFTTSLVLVRTSIPENPLADRGWGDGAGRVRLAILLMPFAGIAFLWFLGVVRDLLGDSEDRFFASVLFGSGLLFLAMLFVTMGLAGGILTLSTVDTDQEHAVEVIRFGRITMLQISNVYALRMAAVFMFSSATIWHRTGVMPRWLVVTTYLLAAALLVATSLSVWTTLVFPGWVLLVSVLVLVRSFRAERSGA